MTLRRTSAIRLLALILSAALLAACGGPADAETGGDDDGDDNGGTSSDEQITLSMWTFGEMGFTELIEEFEADNPHITVEIRQGEFDAHHDALLTALAGGDVPDIAAVEVGMMSQFLTAADQFVNLYDMGAGDIEGDYLDWRWAQAMTPDGETVIGLPTDVGGMAVAYRSDLFAEAGLPTDRDEVSALWPTWEDFLEVGRGFTEETGIAFIDGGASLFSAVYRQSDKTFYEDDGELIYDSNPQVRRGWDIATTAITDGISADLGNFTPEWNAAMAGGDYAVQMAPAWMMGYIQGQAPDSGGLWDIAAMPEGGGNWGGSQLTIPARAAHPEEAYELISFLLSPEGQLQVFEDYGNFPSIPSLYDGDAVQSFSNPFFSDAPVGAIYAESAQSLEPSYEGPDQRAITREFENALLRVTEGAESPEEGWNSALEAIRRDVGD